MKRSSAWMRRLSAGADSASSCAAALIEPRRATWTNASLAVNGGRRRMAELLEVQAETRSEEHTSELPSLMRISYAVLCLKSHIHTSYTTHHTHNSYYH